MSIVETKKVFRENAVYQDTDELFGTMDQWIKGLIERKAEDLIPHIVLSHGFMEWEKILFSQFPELAWRGKEAEAPLTYEQWKRPLYERFFSRVKELPVFEGRDESTMVILKEAGWQAYIED